MEFTDDEILFDQAQAHGDSAEMLLVRLRYYHPDKDRAGVQDFKAADRQWQERDAQRGA